MASFPPSIDEDEMLVLLVQNNHILYDKSLSDYKNVDKKKDAWNEIASDMFEVLERTIKVKDLVNRWKSLKRKFVKEHRKVTEYIPSGSSAPTTTSQWKYYDQMKFLVKHIQHRRTTSNFRNAADSSTDEDVYEGDEEDDEMGNLEDSQEDGHLSRQLDAPASARTRRPPAVNNYLLVFSDAWARIPGKNKRDCYSEIIKVIHSKKQHLEQRT